MPLSADTVTRQLSAWLARRAPASAPQVVAVTPPAQGYSNETWLLEVERTLNGQRTRESLVLRCAPEHTALFEHYSLSLQYRVMAALAASDVPVPPLLGDEADPAYLGRPFYLMRRIDGRIPNENPQYHLSGWFSELSPADCQRHWFAGIALCARVARLDWRALGLDFLLPAGDPLTAQLDQLASFLAWTEAQARPYPLIRQALARLRAQQPQDYRLALVWGDAKLGNLVFAADGSIAAALDWEGAHIGAALEDLAWFLVLDRSLAEGYGTPRLAALPARAASIAHWEAVSGESAAGLPWFELLAATRLAIIMARLGTLFTANGVVPASVEMDINNGGHAVLALTLAEQDANGSARYGVQHA